MLKTALGRDDNSLSVKEYVAGEIYEIGDDLYRGFLEQEIIEKIFEPSETKIIDIEIKEKPKRGRPFKEKQNA